MPKGRMDSRICLDCKHYFLDVSIFGSPMDRVKAHSVLCRGITSKFEVPAFQLISLHPGAEGSNCVEICSLGGPCWPRDAQYIAQKVGARVLTDASV